LYIKNIILDNLIQELTELSRVFSVKFGSGKDIKKNEKFSYFEDTFIGRNNDILDLYRDSLCHTIIEGRLPEYILILESKFLSYHVIKDPKNQNTAPTIEAKLKVKFLLKSWIKEIKQWDTRETDIIIPFNTEINAEKYANMENPFGIRFTSIKIPTILKPKASDVTARTRTRR